jgi:hypothetical protein
LGKFYITGGSQQENAQAHTDWFCYVEARILSVDKSGSVSHCATYITPDEIRPEDPRSNIVFKAGSLNGDTLTVCTQTEILVYSLPDFQQVHYLTHPWLNDVHHVVMNNAGNYLVANTGLDQVLELSPDGSIVQEWSVLPGVDTWDRFDRTIDYRKVVTTKPHHSHPNYVVEYHGDLWVSRFAQKDLLCLSDPTRRLDVGIQSVHDGIIHDDRVFMTTVDGHVIVGDLREGRILSIHNLNSMTQTNKTLGWCRGIHVIDENRVIVGFSRIRPSKIRENLRWVKYRMGIREDEGRLPTRIACYNFTEKRVEWEVNLEDHGLNAVFSILPAD